MKLLFGLLFVAIVVALPPRWKELTHKYSYEQYKADFGKVYDCEEMESMKKAIFEENLATILRHNSAGESSYKMGVNHMTDWTLDERESAMGYHKGLGQMQHVARNEKFARGHLSIPAEFSNVVAPHQVEWRGKGVLTAVKDQGHCGSCWTFATTETIEAHYALATGLLPNLSEQHILDCVPNPQQCGGTGGCGGGTTELAFEGLEPTGLAAEWTYPYISYQGAASSCQYNSHKTGGVAQISGYQVLPSNDQDTLEKAVAFVGPIAVSVDAGKWHLYETGVFDGCNQDKPDINHAVQLVGYGYDQVAQKKFWTIRNSWSPDFGEGGYIRIFKEDTPRCGIDTTPLDGTACVGGPSNVTVCGTCGVLYDSAYPLIQS